MIPALKIPNLTIGILSAIVDDAAKFCPHVVAVGLVGSFARGGQVHSSDVDLILKVDCPDNFRKALENFGEHVRHVLDYQFNKRLDIVRYELVAERAGRDPHSNEMWFCREGFKKMLAEVKWLYER